MSKHIRIAKTEGAAAGLAALVDYLDSPLGASNPRMEEVREALSRKRTDATRLKWYCTAFGVAEKPKKAKGVSTRKASARSTRSTRTSTSVITKGEAWVALGSDPDFEPNDPDAPASGGVLYRLNVEGLLSA